MYLNTVDVDLDICSSKSNVKFIYGQNTFRVG